MAKHIKIHQILKSPVTASPKVITHFQVFVYGDNKNIKDANHIHAKIDIWMVCDMLETPNLYRRDIVIERFSRCNLDLDRREISKDGVVIKAVNNDSVVAAAADILDAMFNEKEYEHS